MMVTMIMTQLDGHSHKFHWLLLMAHVFMF